MENKLGVIKENALADLIIIKGNPLNDLSIFMNSKENLLFLMKGGLIKKRLLN